MAGSAISLEASNQGHEVIGKTSSELDLTDRQAVFKELIDTKPDSLVIAAAKVGGIGANSSLPTNFLSINLQIQTNLLDAAHAAKIERVLFLGSSCIYPKLASQPIPETALLTGALEPTNEFYAIAKIAGLKLVEGYSRSRGNSSHVASSKEYLSQRCGSHKCDRLCRQFIIHQQWGRASGTGCWPSRLPAD